MKKVNSFLKLVRSLEAGQVQKLSAMVQSGLTGLNSTTKALYKVILSGEVDAEDDRAVWQKIHSDRPFNAGSMRKLYSDLNAAAHTFLAFSAVLEKEEWKEFLKYQSGTDESRDLLLAGWKKSLKKLGLQGPKRDLVAKKTDVFFVGHQIYQAKYNQEIRLRQDPGYLEQSMDCLDKYYILKKLKYFCEAKLNSSILIHPYGSRWSQEIWLQAQQPEYQATPLIALYTQILTLLNSLGELPKASSAIGQQYLDLKQFLRQHLSSIAPEELRDILNLCQNICIAIDRNTQVSKKDELEDLFQLRLQTGTFLVNGHVLPEEYKNRISFLLIHNRIPEARQFLNDFKSFLQDRFFHDVYYFSLGGIQFYEGNFSAMRKSFQEVSADDPFFILDLKSLSIKAYFLEDEPFPLPSSMDALKHFIKRHTKLSHSRLEMHQHRLNAFQRLYRLLYGARQSPKQLKELKAMLNQYASASDEAFWKKMIGRLQQTIGK